MGTYAIIYLKNKNSAAEVNQILKEKFGCRYENYNGVDYGFFYSEQMLSEDIRFINEDEEGLKQMPDQRRPISEKTFLNLKFGVNNCFGNVGTACIKISSFSNEEKKFIEAFQNFYKVSAFKKFVNVSRSKNLNDLLALKL